MGMDQRHARALCSLAGLSVGDSFGDQFFGDDAAVLERIDARFLPPAPWQWTDDTQMAAALVAHLGRHGEIDQGMLARGFAAAYEADRGYGPSMHRWLRRIADGESWQAAATETFAGQGSYGNGAAMRVAPLGAYFADDLDTLVEQARLSAEVTHAHPEGVVGAVAVAAAAAWAWRLRAEKRQPDFHGFLEQVLPLIPPGDVRAGVRRALAIGPEASLRFAVSVLGNGVGMSAQDTVPLALWCAARSLSSFEEALWLTVGALGDRDTLCAIAGGIVVMYTGQEGIPPEWLARREPLPEWVDG